MRPSRELANLTAAGAFSALLFATGAAVPLLGPPAGFFAAAPLIWLTARHGLRTGALGALLGVAALLPTLPPPVTLIYAVEHALPAVFLGWWLAAGRPLSRGAALAAAVVTALVLGVALLLAGGDGRDPVALLEEQLRAAFAELGGATSGAPGAGVQAGLPANFDEIMAFLRRVLPAVTLVGIYLECAVNGLVAARVLARAAPGLRAPNLAAFALPEWLVWALIPVLALVWIPSPQLATPALNLLLPLLFAYLLQGLSIMLHFAARARIGRLGQILAGLSFAVSPYLLLLPLLVGMLDFRVGFRSRWPLAPPAA